jgi:hypothetical protein
LSGLLRRLAGQALGEPSPVRPRSHARFAEPTTIPQGDEATSPPLVDPSVDAEPREVRGESARTRREPSASERAPRTDQPRATSPRRASTLLEEPAPVRRPALPEEPPLLLPRERAEPGKVTARIAPAPFSADRNAAQATATSRSERRSLSSGRERGSEPNEVHVHIGRIEVTAVHEAPRQRENPARPASSRRLEDYLRPRGAR